MANCPKPDRLLRLLGDDPPEGNQAELFSHLETCTNCRGLLDRMAAQSGIWNDLALLRDPPSTALFDDDASRLEGILPEDESIPLGLMEPPDEPGYLGKLGPYSVIRQIGRGGMGIVFLAKDKALNRLVAIKLLTPGMAATGAARRRFAREARAAAAVVHEHVVTIHAVDTLPQGVPYLVMQYVAGKSAQELIDRGQPTELVEILRIGSQAAGALAAAHAQGLIHRDIKPANILLEDGVDRVKITDFGLARAVDDASISQSGVVAGTPQYMSPEQAGGEPVDHRTDLFSLGSVLYALCTGQAPFRGNSSMATLRKVCEQAPRPIGSFSPDTPPWLVKIINKLHAKNPSDRYQSAAEVASLFGRCLAHVQQPTGSPLPAELLPARRRRSLAVWGAVPVCLLLACLLGLPAARAAAEQAAGYVATVLRLKTPEGTIVVEAEDPDISLRLDGSELVVTGAGVKELRLSAGPHTFQALKDGKVLRDELVTVSRGGRTVLKIRRETGPEPVQAAPASSPVPPTPASLPVPPTPASLPVPPTASPNHSQAQEVERMVEVLRNRPLRPRIITDRGMRIYIRDLVQGQTSLVADPTAFSVGYAEIPEWSHDGQRIVFHIQPRKSDWTNSEIVLIEGRGTLSRIRKLGPGCCASLSPDGQTIAYLQLESGMAREQPGIVLMKLDGSARRTIDIIGAPTWSPDGTRLLINSIPAPTEVKIHDLAKDQTVNVNVPGKTIYSWARWAGPNQLIASLGGEKEPDSLAILDIENPPEAKVARTLWRRSSSEDVFPRWPVISASTGKWFFIGESGDKRTILTAPAQGDGQGPLTALESGGPKLSGLSISPDGRYLLFASDRFDLP